MEWVGIIGLMLVLLAVFGFYLGVPLSWGKFKKGKDLNAGDRHTRRQH